MRDELLTQLAQALDGLTKGERDGLALRFAARLSMAHVDEVLGTSVGGLHTLIAPGALLMSDVVYDPSNLVDVARD